MKDPTPNDDYIKGLEEWQKHQYDPGYFTGGRIPVWLRDPGRPKLLGGFFVAAGLIGLGAFVYSVVVGDIVVLTDWISAIPGGIMILLTILLGIKYLRKKK